MTGKKNNIRRNVLIIIAIVAVITVLVLLNGELDSKIANHPKITTMEANQKNIDEALKEIKAQLKEIDRKMNKLLRDEYGP